AKVGGARDKRPSPEQRKKNARKAAAARWNVGELPQAICSSEDKPLQLAGVDLDAYFLDDGTRVLSQAGFLRALGRNKRAATRSLTVPPMMQGSAFAPFLTPEIMELAKPIAFWTPNAGPNANGYRAELLPQASE